MIPGGVGGSASVRLPRQREEKKGNENLVFSILLLIPEKKKIKFPPFYHYDGLFSPPILSPFLREVEALLSPSSRHRDGYENPPSPHTPAPSVGIHTIASSAREEKKGQVKSFLVSNLVFFSCWREMTCEKSSPFFQFISTLQPPHHLHGDPYYRSYSLFCAGGGKRGMKTPSLFFFSILLILERKEKNPFSSICTATMPYSPPPILAPFLREAEGGV